MAGIVPFRGVRYARGEPLGSLIAPPYDVISPEQRDALVARSPRNVVHLVLPQDCPGDGPDQNRYTRAARLWNEWLAQGVLRTDPRPSIYPLEQIFRGPDGRSVIRRGVVVAVRLHAFSEGVIVPHEMTFTGPKADRLELLKHVRANLSPIFGLYHDERNEVLAALSGAVSVDPTAEAESDEDVRTRMWRVDDPGTIAAVQRILAPRRIFIADGHHRYETALAYRDLLDRATPDLPADGGHRYIPMFVCSMSDPGLVMYPTHRLVYGLRDLSLRDFLERLERYFTVETLSEDVHWPAGRAWAVSRLAERGGKSTAFLMVTAADQRARILTLRDEVPLPDDSLPRSETLRALDVTVLHGVVLDHLLGLSPDAQEQQRNLAFVMDAGEAVSRTLSGEFQIGFLLNPTPMWQVQAVAEGGEKMPQKSTFIYPRLPSGFVMRAIDPRERMGGPGA